MGDAEAQRVTEGGTQKSALARSRAQSQLARLNGVEGGASAAADVNTQLGRLDQQIRSATGEMATQARARGAEVAQKLRADVPALQAKLGEGLQASLNRVEAIRAKAATSLDTARQEARTAVEAKGQEAKARIEARRATDLASLQQVVPGAEASLQESVAQATARVDQDAAQILEQIDAYVAQVAEVRIVDEAVESASADLESAVEAGLGESGGRVDAVLTAVQGAGAQAGGQLGEVEAGIGEVLDGTVNGFKTDATTATAAFEEKLQASTDAANAEYDLALGDARSALDKALAEAGTGWQGQIDTAAKELRGRVDGVLRELDGVVSRVGSEISGAVDEAVRKSERSTLGKIWDGIKSVGSFLGGLVVGIVEGLVDLVVGLVKALATPLFWIIAAVVAVVVVALVLIFGWAAVLTAIVVIGVIAAIAFAGYYVYLAVTTPGLSAYERGKLFGRAVTELALGIVGTGIWARLTGGLGKISRFASVVQRLGSLGDGARLLRRVGSVDELVTLLDKAGDAATAEKLLDRFGDASTVLKRLEGTDDVARLLSEGDDAARAINGADDAAKVVDEAATPTTTAGASSADDIAKLPGRATPVEDAFVEQFRTRNPGSPLTEAELRGKFRDGYRMDESGALAKVGDDVAVQVRQAENQQLLDSPMFQADLNARGVSAERLAWMREKKCPLTFENPQQYETFRRDLAKVLDEAGLGDAQVSMKGTSTTFYSENPKKMLGHHFDANPSELADIDLGLSSAQMVDAMSAAGKGAHPQMPHIFKTRHTVEVYPALKAFAEKWQGILGREVNFVGLTDKAPQALGATDYLVFGK